MSKPKTIDDQITEIEQEAKSSLTEEQIEFAMRRMCEDQKVPYNPDDQEVREMVEATLVANECTSKEVVSMFAIGRALTQIREKKTYEKLGYNFGDYIKDKVSCQKSSAYRYMDIFDVKEFYGPEIDSSLYTKSKKHNLYDLIKIAKKKMVDGNAIDTEDMKDHLSRAAEMEGDDFKDFLKEEILGEDITDPFDTHQLAGNNYRLVLMEEDDCLPDPKDDDRFEKIGSRSITFYTGPDGDTCIHVKAKR